MAFDISKYTEASREPDAVRDIGTITTEILRLKQDAGNAILSIGQRLIEAKGHASAWGVAALADGAGRVF